MTNDNIVFKGITINHKEIKVCYLNLDNMYLLHGEALLVITTVDPEHVSLELKQQPSDQEKTRNL